MSNITFPKKLRLGLRDLTVGGDPIPYDTGCHVNSVTILVDYLSADDMLIEIVNKKCDRHFIKDEEYLLHLVFPMDGLGIKEERIYKGKWNGTKFQILERWYLGNITEERE